MTAGIKYHMQYDKNHNNVIITIGDLASFVVPVSVLDQFMRKIEELNKKPDIIMPRQTLVDVKKLKEH